MGCSTCKSVDTIEDNKPQKQNEGNQKEKEEKEKKEKEEKEKKEKEEKEKKEQEEKEKKEKEEKEKKEKEEKEKKEKEEKEKKEQEEKEKKEKEEKEKKEKEEKEKKEKEGKDINPDEQTGAEEESHNSTIPSDPGHYLKISLKTKKNNVFIPNKTDLERFQRDGLKRHNYYRKYHQSGPMELTQKLNDYAQKYAETLAAKKCSILHMSKEKKYMGIGLEKIYIIFGQALKI